MRLSRCELTSAISSRSFPKGKTKNDESSALIRKRPSRPSLIKNRSTHLVVVTMSSGRRVSSNRCIVRKLLRRNHDILTKIAEYGSGVYGLHVQQSLDDREPHHDPWLCKLKSPGKCVRTL